MTAPRTHDSIFTPAEPEPKQLPLPRGIVYSPTSLDIYTPGKQECVAIPYHCITPIHFTDTGMLIWWHEDLYPYMLDAMIESGLMTRKFYRHLYGHEDYTLTPAGRALVDSL
jgi:hypothetical protein